MLTQDTRIGSQATLIDANVVIEYLGSGITPKEFEGKILFVGSHSSIKVGDRSMNWQRELWAPAPHKLGTVLQLQADPRVTVVYEGLRQRDRFQGTIKTGKNPSFFVGECRNDWVLQVWEPVDVWKQAVWDRCVESCIEFYPEDPRRTLGELLHWEAKTSLDPQVSGTACQLRDTYLRRMNIAENRVNQLRKCLGEFDVSGV